MKLKDLSNQLALRESKNAGTKSVDRFLMVFSWRCRDFRVPPPIKRWKFWGSKYYCPVCGDRLKIRRRDIGRGLKLYLCCSNDYVYSTYRPPIMPFHDGVF